MYKAVIFDLDGVITDTARFHFLSWKHIATQEGLTINEEFNEKLKGVDRMSSLELVLATGQKKYTDSQKYALAEQKNEYYKQLIKGMTADNLLPGAFSLLTTLRKNGIKVGLASASKNAGAILDRLGITNLFDYVVDTNRIVHGKPDPEIFLTAAKELQVNPEQSVGVEDAVAGIQAIKAAGMYAVGVGDPNILNQADCVIADLTKFPLQEVCGAVII